MPQLRWRLPILRRMHDDLSWIRIRLCRITHTAFDLGARRTSGSRNAYHSARLYLAPDKVRFENLSEPELSSPWRNGLAHVGLASDSPTAKLVTAEK